ncbi:AraC family transcriptional regulator [Paenibacillus psychroresistens]|uniref:AraC family transcriptional regulator n=1 Tax=Paenibacillus psychroresistens TaxID=1778678 RepID=A0A6B8RP99_9BACL|nr:AraC family transcriptional regulator [Paenibacillus psychroresistens]QGQ98170.1 AraC family transcriptional regulator [Paenibacillus psychroresistens]
MPVSLSFLSQQAASWQDLTPSVHWAQSHQRAPQFEWKRRIYDYELLYVRQGVIKVNLGGESLVVSAGIIILLPAGIQHEIEIISKPNASMLGIHFDFFGELKASRDEDIIVDEKQPLEHDFCTMPIIDAQPLFTFQTLPLPPTGLILMEAIIHEWTQQKLGFQLACRGLLLHLFAQLIRLQTENKRILHPKYEANLIQLVQALDIGYAEKWTTTRMANYLNVHEDYMTKLFKDRMGISPVKYLNSNRHAAAKLLLRETDEQIEAIARMVGYEDIHYFSRVFRQRESMTAFQYRRFSQL